VKLKYEIKLGAFTIAYSLPFGLSYPFDWGFVPSTQGPDGDPLDILILHEASTYPGVEWPSGGSNSYHRDCEDDVGGSNHSLRYGFGRDRHPRCSISLAIACHPPWRENVALR
jgi:hypothetical protein